jgi:3-oxosteroid 1-dehydrogenase
LNANNVPILTGHRVVAVVQNDEGAVIGVEATITSGDSATPSAVASPSAGESRVAVKANKAVIFGSGGFIQNPDMRVNFLRGPVFGGCAVITNEGDLVKIASDVGAELGNMANAFWAQVPLEQALSYSSTPSDVFLIPGDTSILVNKYGVRIVNETIQYNERTQSHFVWDPVAAEFPNLVEILIYDQRGADLVGGQYPIPSADDVDAPDLIKGETLEELAAAIDERLALLSEHIGGLRLAENFTENLAATIERYNGFARTGVDDDFHRGEAPISLAFFGPALEGNAFPNKTMYPISDTGPYYAILIGGGTLDTKGGPRVNTQAQILRPNGEPIPGLYGTGNCIASPAGQAYWGAGGTIGVGIVYGYRAALNANDEPVKTA